jgi:hypothetical protein
MRLNKYASFTLLLACLWLESAMAIEEPHYDVIVSQPPFELRHYAPTLIAQTIVDGDMDAASSKGFRLIANYIFGNNVAMTTPVTVEPQSGDTRVTGASQWRIHFVMPSQYTLANIPKPINSAVTLHELPRKYMAVYRYSGFNTQARVQEKTEEALAWAKQQSLKIVGAPQLSRYDPPWTLPMFRRNEIMVEVAAP